MCILNILIYLSHLFALFIVSKMQEYKFSILFENEF